jgi:hypothetical protein
MPESILLTAQQKGCVLRACRKEIDMLQNELDRLQKLNRRHLAGAIEAVESEIDCLAAAVTILWNMPEGNSS